MLGISRSRFYELQRRGVFPAPQRTSSNRPVFDQQLTQQCVEVVRTRVGLNGEPILFNRKPVQQSSRKRTATTKPKHEDLVTALGSLGLTATPDQVSTAVSELPNQGADLDAASLIKAVFLHLKKARG